MNSGGSTAVVDPDRVIIAEIFRPRGNRGEVIANSLTDVPGRFETLKRAQVRLSDGSDVSVEIEAAWPHKDQLVLKFAGVDTISDADRFRNSELWVAPSERGKLPEGEYFQSDILGCRLVNEATGEEIGAVTGWQAYGGPPLMELEIEGREVLIPFVPEICKQVDIANKRIMVALPEGILDL